MFVCFFASNPNRFPYAAEYLGCDCVSSTNLDASGIPEYTPNDCNVNLDSIPTCGVFDNTYTIGQRCGLKAYDVAVNANAAGTANAAIDLNFAVSWKQDARQ